MRADWKIKKVPMRVYKHWKARGTLFSMSWLGYIRGIDRPLCRDGRFLIGKPYQPVFPNGITSEFFSFTSQV